MKQLISYMMVLILIGILFIGCTKENAPTAAENETQNSLEKVTVDEYSLPVNLDGAIIENCTTGEDMINYGTIEVYIVETHTPSGNTTLRGYSDYFIYGPVTVVGDISGTWNLIKGQNYFGEVYKDGNLYPDWFIQHFEWHETYQNEVTGEKLRVFVNGLLKVDPDGNVLIERYNSRCF